MNKDFNKNNEDKIENIKIIEIRNNEYFGDALMFLNEPSPLVAKVKTKIAELLILRKMEAVEIYSIYPNIWKRINKKSLFNMEQIYLKIKKIIIKLSKKYNIKIVEIYFNKKRNENKHIKEIKRKEDKKKVNLHKKKQIKENQKLFETKNNSNFNLKIVSNLN